MSRYSDHRERPAALRNLRLNLEAVQPRQAHVEGDAAGFEFAQSLEELVSVGKGAAGETAVGAKLDQHGAHALLVVDNVNWVGL